MYVHINVMHLRVIDVTERIDGNVGINGRRKKNFTSRRISRAYKITSDETRGKILKKNTQENKK